jgi:DNA polymerase
VTPDPLAPLSTDPNDFCFLDTETRSTENVKIHGAYRHNRNGRVTILVFAIGDAPVVEWALPDFAPGRKLSWGMAPTELLDFLYRVRGGRAWFVAHNAAFDVLACSRGMKGLRMDPSWFIDTMVQFTRSHLPADLMGASLVAKVKAVKHSDGKRLIEMFAVEGSPHTPQSDPEDWQRFLAYARDDVNAMREIFWGTMPLPRRTWEEYWVSERINHRGIPMDEKFVRGAAVLAAFAADKANGDITRLTGDADINKVTQAARLIEWVREKLVMLPEVDRILTREFLEEPGEDGEDVRQVPKYSLERTRAEELIVYLERMDEEQGLTDDEFAALEVLKVRLYGASATPQKFGKALLAIDEGRIKGQYVFCGAAATTRYSSRGLQIHNLTRSVVGSRDDELDAIEMITELGGES